MTRFVHLLKGYLGLLIIECFACRCITTACILKAKHLFITQKARCWAVKSLDGSCMLLLFETSACADLMLSHESDLKAAVRPEV